MHYKFIIILIWFIGFNTDIIAQDLKHCALSSYKQRYKIEKTHKRHFISLKDTKHKINQLWLLPSGGLYYLYQNILSEQLQNTCSYTISCSQYAKLMTAKYGLAGLLMGFNQFTNCTHNNYLNYEAYKKADNGKIVNSISK